jgi:regulator of replication initiation timing
MIYTNKRDFESALLKLQKAGEKLVGLHDLKNAINKVVLEYDYYKKDIVELIEENDSLSFAVDCLTRKIKEIA